MKTSRILLAVVLMLLIVVAVVMLLHNDAQRRARAKVTKSVAAKTNHTAKSARPTAKAETARPKPTPAKGLAGNTSPDTPPPPHRRKGAGKGPATAAPVAQALPTTMPAAEGADKNVPAHVAREALKLVGSDPVAEHIWIDAINNPALPAADRKNLIEDLNEAGFADPKNPTEAELPLIQHRIALLERLAPAPMDEVNAAAFAEAYKDLKNLSARLTQPPQPQPQSQPEQPMPQPQPQPEQPQPPQPQPEQPQQ